MIDDPERIDYGGTCVMCGAHVATGEAHICATNEQQRINFEELSRVPEIRVWFDFLKGEMEVTAMNDDSEYPPTPETDSSDGQQPDMIAVSRAEWERVQAQLADQEILISKSGAMIVQQRAQLSQAREALENITEENVSVIVNPSDLYPACLAATIVKTADIARAALAAMEEKP